MSVAGTVTSISPDWRGDTLALDTTALDTVLEVEDATDFDEDGGWLTIADSAPVAYTGIDDDAGTVTLTAAVGAVYEAGLPVVLWDPSVPPDGAKVVEYLASVDLGDGVISCVLPHELIPSAGVDNLIGASVSVEDDADGDWYVAAVYGREPVLDGSVIDPATLPTPALTDGDPPDNAPTVTFIGGIGSLFFRWTEITNADPVTYRLHVRAGSAPTTDGTYEVAAGVGLTSASVRKLKDGTAIVGGGSVTYYGIVSVEDADGPGPASASVSGIPAQVTGPDIAVGAVTTDELVFNSGWGAELNSETITGALVRSNPSGPRTELRDAGEGYEGVEDLRFYTGVTDEAKYAYIGAYAVGPSGQRDFDLIIKSPAIVGQAANVPEILLKSSTDPAYPDSTVWITADRTSVSGSLDATMGGGDVGTDSFRDSVDARVTAVAPAIVTAVAPTVTMTTGSVGTGTFRDSVRDAIAEQDSGWLSASGSFAGSVRLIKRGDEIAVYGEVARASSFSTAFTSIGATAPTWARAATYKQLPGAVATNGGSYQFRITSSGAIEIRQSQAITQDMLANGSYLLT